MKSKTYDIPNEHRGPLLTRFRFWLIGLLAGRSVVILNAHLDKVRLTSDCAVVIEACSHGVLIGHCHFVDVIDGFVTRVRATRS